MKKVGIVGIGDMGSGIAKNLLAAGFDVYGWDLKPERLQAFVEMGGIGKANPGEVGKEVDACFVMVMTGAQASEVVMGSSERPGLVGNMADGGTVIMTATINPFEIRAINEGLSGTGLTMIDSPVSGGFPGAQSGNLTLMAAGSDSDFDACQGPLEAISKVVHRVGVEPGLGQTMKACLQAIIGGMFTSLFEGAALAAKAGISGEALHKVVTTSSAGNVLAETSLSSIIDRKFEGTGSHINTMYKDLTISLDMARELGVPLFTAATAMQLFQAGKTKHPTGDNWIITRVMEDIVGSELHRDGGHEIKREEFGA